MERYQTALSPFGPRKSRPFAERKATIISSPVPTANSIARSRENQVGAILVIIGGAHGEGKQLARE